MRNKIYHMMPKYFKSFVRADTFRCLGNHPLADRMTCRGADNFHYVFSMENWCLFWSIHLLSTFSCNTAKGGQGGMTNFPCEKIKPAKCTMHVWQDNAGAMHSSDFTFLTCKACHPSRSSFDTAV